MEQKLKYSLLAKDVSDDSNIWTRNEKRIWFVALLLGTSALYSTRTTMPLLMPAVAAERKWSKTDSGTVLSSFFWGYTLTQVLGGYLSDRLGGQRVILTAAVGWSIITLWMPQLIWFINDPYLSVYFIVAIRVANGAFQGVHFPSMISLTSQRLPESERASYFSTLTVGSALGTLLTGSLGSFLLDYFGWPSVFHIIGFLGVCWALALRYLIISSNHNVILSVPRQLSRQKLTVPWLTLMSKFSFWACVVGHACQTNCFFVLLSWMPTYFHDTFPEAKGWVVNMVPWLSLVPCTVLARFFSEYLINRGTSLTLVRKIIQSLCFACEVLGLYFLSGSKTFYEAMFWMVVIIGGTGFHNNGITVNPQDLAPTHAGSVFGLMNTVGSVPGFLGVYLAGHILEVTQSWPAVFNLTAAISLCGWLLYLVFGTAKPIV
uniref:Putative permease of the major facilitator superfamily protein n=1 Tax=Xenopsylla cheopis TaxID=163159 RepID=A0A6M2DGB8_XENCH